MEFVILIVRTLDWVNIDAFPWPCCEAKRWQRFIGRVEHWNRNFSINYFNYRARLKEISLKSFEATGIPIVECAHYEEASEFLNKNNWYHPDS